MQMAAGPSFAKSDFNNALQVCVSELAEAEAERT